MTGKQVRVTITAGALRGRSIACRRSATTIRPTAERIRAAIADSLQTRIAGAMVADLCAGTGAVGFELLSRGAREALFVEQNPGLVRDIKRNVQLLGYTDTCRVIASDVRLFLRKNHPVFDIVYIDPPYITAGAFIDIPTLLSCCAPGGVCVYEVSKKDVETLSTSGFEPDRIKTYGDTACCFFARR